MDESNLTVVFDAKQLLTNRRMSRLAYWRWRMSNGDSNNFSSLNPHGISRPWLRLVMLNLVFKTAISNGDSSLSNTKSHNRQPTPDTINSVRPNSSVSWRKGERRIFKYAWVEYRRHTFSENLIKCFPLFSAPVRDWSKVRMANTIRISSKRVLLGSFWC